MRNPFRYLLAAVLSTFGVTNPAVIPWDNGQGTAQPTPPAQPVPQPQAVPVAPAPQASPAQPAPASPYLQGDQSVYYSPEEAVRGINEKDRVIAEMRDWSIQNLGFDPVTRRQVTAAPSHNGGQQPYEMPAPGEMSAEDFRRAVAQEVNQRMAPMVPLARNTALETMRSRYKDWDQLSSSEHMRHTLQEMPMLNAAIVQAQNDPQFAGQLPELYDLAYRSAKMSQIGRSQAAAQPSGQSPSPQAVGLAPSGATPQATPVPQAATAVGFSDIATMSPEQRRQYIANMRARGADSVAVRPQDLSGARQG